MYITAVKIAVGEPKGSYCENATLHLAKCKKGFVLWAIRNYTRSQWCWFLVGLACNKYLCELWRPTGDITLWFLQRIIALFGKSEFYDKNHAIYVCNFKNVHVVTRMYIHTYILAKDLKTLNDKHTRMWAYKDIHIHVRVYYKANRYLHVIQRDGYM